MPERFKANLKNFCLKTYNVSNIIISFLSNSIIYRLSIKNITII